MPGRHRFRALAAMLESTGDALSGAELARTFGRPALRSAVAHGLVVRLLEGQYAAATHATSTRTRAMATSAWLGERGLVGGVTAAFLIDLADDPRCVHVQAVPRIHVRGPRWMRIRHRKPTLEAHVVQGVRIPAVADIAIQAWEQLPNRERSNMIIESVRQEYTSAADILLRMAQYPTVHSRRHLLALLEDVAGGIDSYLELVAARDVFGVAGFPKLERHVQLRGLRRDHEADFFEPHAMLDIETDGRAVHNDDVQRRRDLARDVDLASAGIQTLRFTFEDIVGRPQWCRDVVLATISQRRQSPSTRSYG